jgi:8-oxo-dGTP pyrophosphatase MutT (NUDIX family)
MYGDIRQFLADIFKGARAVTGRYQYAKSKFFYRQDFISALLFNRTHLKLPNSGFIDYRLPFQYYSADRKKITMRRDGETKEIEIGYKELINFIDNPKAKIMVKGELTPYHQPNEMIGASKDAFAAFMHERPNITNGPTLRLKTFDAHKDSTYVATLQSSSYFVDVRGELSLDYPIDGNPFDTMRIRDVGDDGNLRPLNDSIFGNDIGVFTVVAFFAKGEWYFHMLPRQNNLGVFNGMLSSVGGAVEPPKEQIDELVTYATAEIKREFHEETGLDAVALEKEGRCQVIPLAFTRELSRGGKPQFFYLTLLQDITEKEFARGFKGAEWKNEFRSDFLSNVTALDDVFSPEFSTALFYAYEYLQKQRKIPGDTLILN